METFGASVSSLRQGEIRIEDVLSQVGDLDTVEVLVLDRAGNTQHITVSLTDKWASTHWQKCLQCGRCHSPARVLLVDNGIGLCRRCHPHASAHHLHKNSTLWTGEGAIFDALLRSIMKPQTEPRRRRQRKLTSSLKRNTLTNAVRTLDKAMQTIGAADTLHEYANDNDT